MTHEERAVLILAIMERRLPANLRGPGAMSDEEYRAELERLSDTELWMRFEQD
jgi:hypothetical protein